MFDSANSPGSVATVPPEQVSLAEWETLLARTSTFVGAEATEAELIDHLTAMERLKSGLAAAQARVTATLAAKRSLAEAARGIPAADRCRGLASEIALARRESPSRGGLHYGMSTALVHEMPHTLAAFARGDISELKAMLVVKEPAVLTLEHRRQVDIELAGRLADLGDRQAAAQARKIGYRLDPGSALRRVRGARGDRYVGLRPAPDTMSYLTGFLPVEQGVACKVALEKRADELRSEGDPRTRGQIMADLLFERVTGAAAVDGPDIEVQVVITDKSLLGNDHEAARVAGFGPIPAGLARDLVRSADRVWIRRMFTSPDEASLVAMESHRREFKGGLRRFLIARDDVCRTNWCDAPVRHLDHARPVAAGGPTTADNGQGLCEACNYAKESRGWQAAIVPSTPHQIETTTPTGHHYRSRAPAPPGHRPDLFSPLELQLGQLLSAA